MRERLTSLFRSKTRVASVVITIAGLLLISHLLVECNDLRFYQPAADASVRALEDFRAQRPRVDVVVIGSSRVRRAVTTRVLEETAGSLIGRPVSAYNLGLQAGTMPAFYILVRDLLAEPRAPHLILLCLGTRSMNSNSPRYPRTLRHLAAPTDLLGPLGPRITRGNELLAVPVALLRAPATLIQLARELTSPGPLEPELRARRGAMYEPSQPPVHLPVSDADLTTWLTPTKISRQRDALEELTGKRAKLAHERLLMDYQVEGHAQWALEQTIALAGVRHIDLVVVNLPVTARFAELAYRRGEYQTYRAAVSALCAGRGIPFVDAAVPSVRPHHLLFADGDHLSALGADGFTRWLAEQIVAPRLKGDRR
jgi:hypothetical protein